MKNSTCLFPKGLCGIIYDCDGVMIDSRSANTLFYNRVLAYFGLPPMTQEQERYTYMATGLQSLEYVLPESLHAKIHEVVTTKVFYSDVVPYLTLMPGFLDFVTRMHTRGYKQAMCTNRTNAGFDEIMKFFSFPPYFDPIMTVSVAPPKPSPVGTRQILESWQIEPECVLFVGDSSYDQEAAFGAKVRFAAFNAINCQGDITAATYDELNQKLEEEMALS